jgi:uncharacterized protein (TIGR00369 family)
MSPGDDGISSYYTEVKRRGREANPFFRLMGIDVSQIRGGEAVLEMAVRPDMHNGEGWLQGGVLVSLADEAMALALYTTLDEGQRIATISESTSFLKGVRDGSLVAVGRVVKRGRRVAFAEGAVYLGSADGELLARTTATFAVLERDSRSQ